MDLRAIGRVVPVIVPCWGEPVVPGELLLWCFLGADNSKPLNKATLGKGRRLWPFRGVLTCQNETLTPSSCLQDMSLLEGEPLRKGCCDEGGADAARQVPGSSVGASARRRPLPCSPAAAGGRCDPQPLGVVSLLIVSAGRPSLRCHHRLLFGCPRSVRRGQARVAVPPSLQSGRVLAPSAAVAAAPLPPQPAPLPWH